MANERQRQVKVNKVDAGIVLTGLWLTREGLDPHARLSTEALNDEERRRLGRVDDLIARIQGPEASSILTLTGAEIDTAAEAVDMAVAAERDNNRRGPQFLAHASALGIMLRQDPKTR